MRIPKLGLAALIILALASLQNKTWGQPALKREPQLWAVIVGIEYREKGKDPLCPGAADDARAFADWLQNTAKWGPENILRMDEVEGLDKPGPASGPARPLTPTGEHLEWAMSQWLDQHVQPGDVVVFW